MIRLFAISSMRHTPFEKKHFPSTFFNDRGIDLTEDESQADIYICQTLPVSSKVDLALFRLRFKKFIPIIVWTFEPRFSTLTRPFIRGSLYFPEVHVMNLYTEGVFLDNYSLFHQYVNCELELIDESHYESRMAKAVGLNGFVENVLPFIINGKNIDLCGLRQELLFEGNKEGVIDIYGKGWPEGTSMGDSRLSVDWHSLKLETLQQYAFNIAIENTNYNYYVSEKIWDSIKAGCLPIYFGRGNKIYETFPKKSFLDLAKYANFNVLFDHIRNMKVDEYSDRLESCIKVYNRIYSNDLNSFGKVLNSVAAKILEISS